MQAIKFIGSSPLASSYTYSYGFFNVNTCYAQSLRWKRKPIWLGTAKSKIFRVPKKPKIPEDEFAEIQRLYNRYRTYLRSTLLYFEKIHKESQVELDPTVIEKAEEEDFERCFEINDKWNKSIAAERKIKLAKEKELKKEKILKNIENMEAMKIKKIQEMDEKLKKLKEIAPTFITKDNIDKAIEEALETTVDYNKAIDRDGNWYTDKSGLPLQKIPKSVQVNQ